MLSWKLSLLSQKIQVKNIVYYLTALVDTWSAKYCSMHWRGFQETEQEAQLPQRDCTMHYFLVTLC